MLQGDYPSLMKERIAEKSELQGFSESRLPQFTPDEIQYINGKCIFAFTSNKMYAVNTSF